MERCPGRRIKRVFVSLGTLAAISVPMVLFGLCQLRYVLDTLGYAVPATLLGVYTAMVLQFVVISSSNPGILQKLQFPANVRNHLSGAVRAVAPQRFLEIPINGQVIRTKYCVTCHIYRPPRTVHCSTCGGCVLRYDHHCPYVSNCIGYNNYRRFTVFVSTCSLYYLSTLLTGVYRLSGFFPQLAESFEKDPLSSIGTLLSIAFSLLILWLVCGLCCFHFMIMGKGQSTYDRIKGNFMDFNPFYRGCSRNTTEILCRRPHFDGFVNPMSRRYQAKSVYQPGAMFVSQQQRDEVLLQNSAFDDLDDLNVLNTQEKNTLKYIKTFGQAQSSAPPPIKVERVAPRAPSDGSDVLFEDTHD